MEKVSVCNFVLNPNSLYNVTEIFYFFWTFQLSRYKKWTWKTWKTWKRLKTFQTDFCSNPFKFHKFYIARCNYCNFEIRRVWVGKGLSLIRIIILLIVEAICVDIENHKIIPSFIIQREHLQCSIEEQILTTPPLPALHNGAD